MNDSISVDQLNNPLGNVTIEESSLSNSTAATKYTSRIIFKIVSYSIMFVFGTIGNSLVSIAALRQHRSMENKIGRTNVHMMVLHLTIADLMVSYVVIPLEIGWAITVQWHAGDVGCKLLMFIRALAYYLSSMLLVCLTLDRFLAIARPLASLKSHVTKRRCHIMIGMAWISASIFALPQTIVYRVLPHPRMPEFQQCTTIGFFEHYLRRSDSRTNATMINDNSSLLNEGMKSSNTSEPKQSFILSPEIAENLYSASFLFAVYILPLSVIIVTYANILNKLYRRSGIDKQFPDDHNHHNNVGHESTNAISENDRPPTYLIRCLTYFRSAVRQERLQRNNANEHMKDVVEEHRSVRSFDTVTTITDRSGESPQTLLTTDGRNSLTVEANDCSQDNSQTRKKKQKDGEKKLKTSFELSDLNTTEDSKHNEDENRIRRTSYSLHAPKGQTPRSVSPSTAMRRNQSVRCTTSKTTSSNIVALRMCAIQVLAFIVCWTPYVSMSLWHMIDKSSANNLNPTVQDALFLTAVLNSCINPLVYGGFYIKSLRKNRSSGGQNYSTHCTSNAGANRHAYNHGYGSNSIDKQQQTPRYKRNDSYEEKKEYRNNLKRNNSESCKSDAKRKEKAGECKEFQVVVTDYS